MEEEVERGGPGQAEGGEERREDRINSATNETNAGAFDREQI